MFPLRAGVSDAGADSIRDGANAGEFYGALQRIDRAEGACFRYGTIAPAL